MSTGLDAVADGLENAANPAGVSSGMNPQINSPDWSEGAITDESEALHGASKFLGGFGFSTLFGTWLSRMSPAGSMTGASGGGVSSGSQRLIAQSVDDVFLGIVDDAGRVTTG